MRPLTTLATLMPLEASRSGHPIAVAIVEDEASVLVGLRRLCESLGLKATVYASGLEFIDSLAVGRRSPRLPAARCAYAADDGAGGAPAAGGKRGAGAHLIYTADDAPEVEARLQSRRSDGYLHKPIAATGSRGDRTSRLCRPW